MTGMRYTVVDESGTFSFVGPGHALKMLAAVCSAARVDGVELVRKLSQFDAELSTAVLNGLAIFDEHCLVERPESFDAWADGRSSRTDEPFRVINERARQQSLRSGPLGIVIFNLKDQRIVQVQNSYSPLRRQDRGRIRIDGRPTRYLYRYALPSEWAIVP